MRLKSIQLKPIHLTEEEAIEKAEEIRDNLVIGAEIISSFDTLNSETDYEELYKQLENIPGINTVCDIREHPSPCLSPLPLAGVPL